jgi:hypothetical protein
MSKLQMTTALAAATVGLLSPGPARAHFLLTSPTNWMTQASDGSPQKTGPCGNEATAGQTATGMVTDVQPGQSVTIKVTATVAHTGWWRVALKEGASSTQTQTSLPDPQATTCTPPIMANPVWSPTQPVLADGLGIAAGATTGVTQSGTQMYQVTIPQSASCTTASPCTLQVIMVMNDHQVPANNCYYHHCADIAFGGSSSGAGGASGTGGATGQGGSGTDAATAAETTGGGCGCRLGGARAASLSSAISILGVLVVLRRRRRRA